MFAKTPIYDISIAKKESQKKCRSKDSRIKAEMLVKINTESLVESDKLIGISKKHL